MGFYLVVGAMVCASLGGWWVVNRRFRASEHLDRCCIACGSTQLQWLAPGVYRCGGCGHEGGWGWAAYRDALRMSELAQLDPAARLAGIRKDLQAAHDALLAAVGDLDRAAEFWPAIGASLGEKYHLDLFVEDEVPDLERTTLDGIGRLYAAKQSLHEARLKAASGPVGTSTAFELPHVSWEDDEAAMPVRRAGPARTAAHAMLAMVDAARLRYFGE